MLEAVSADEVREVADARVDEVLRSVSADEVREVADAVVGGAPETDDPIVEEVLGVVNGLVHEVSLPAGFNEYPTNDLFQGAQGNDNKPILSQLRIGDYVQVITEEHRNSQIFKLLSLAGKRKGKYANTWNVKTDVGIVEVINFDDVFWWRLLMIDDAHNSDEIICDEIFLATRKDETLDAKYKELESWKENRVYQEVEDTGQSSMSVRWVMAKKVVNGNQVIKARLCARGFEEAQDFRTDSPTCSRESLRLSLIVIASNGWKLQSIDIKTAFLQGKGIDREVILKPPREANTNKLWLLQKSVYGLGDAPRSFYLKLSEELVKLGMIISTIDKSLFYAHKDGILVGVVICHVDDILYGGNEFLLKIIDNLRKIFVFGTEQSDMFTYVGINLKQNPDSSIVVDQNSFAASITEISLSKERFKQKRSLVTDEERSMMRSVIGQLNWLAGITRPDLSFEVCQFSSRVKNATVEDIVQLNKVVFRAQKHNVSIRFPKLNINNVQLNVYADASFNNLPDGGSQGGHIVFICDGENYCSPLSWMSTRIKRVVYVPH